ncbi:MAG: trypsin-like peptidase domain-containing protein [Candidatus Nitrotoga sp.]|nr:trypsin-like peptidase domain-containing protein [Candidatus Nitrotoga sp.]
MNNGDLALRHFFETFIVPVCRFSEAFGSASICEFFGTAFFINGNGVFLTASHVMDAANKSIKMSGDFIGLCPRPIDGNVNVACRITSFDKAKSPYDICVGIVDANYPTLLTLADVPVDTWQDVTSWGYPGTAQNRTAGEFWMYGRGFKGYIHRLATTGQMPGVPHPDAFEISFSVPQGLSGSPLFTQGPQMYSVIGVCTGVNRGETTEYLSEELQENGMLTRERHVKIEEYGIAQSLRPLLDWQPANLDGRTLREVSSGRL